MIYAALIHYKTGKKAENMLQKEGSHKGLPLYDPLIQNGLDRQVNRNRSGLTGLHEVLSFYLLNCILQMGDLSQENRLKNQ